MTSPPNEAAAEWVRVGALAPWDKNPRSNQPDAEIARSIIRFGFGAPVIARRDDGLVIAGHTRLKATALLPEWWAHESEPERAKWSADARRIATEPDPRVPVRFLDLSEAEAKALALADNKLGELADWDDPLLHAALRELAEGAIDLSYLGWGDDPLAALAEIAAASPVPGGAPAPGAGAPPSDPPAQAGPQNGDSKGITYQNKYAVVITCDDEPHQKRVFEQMTALGLVVKVLAL